MTVDDLVIDGLLVEIAALEMERTDALAEAATYRQLLLVALENWEADKVRLDGATQRLRQLMGREHWHAEESTNGAR